MTRASLYCLDWSDKVIIQQPDLWTGQIVTVVKDQRRLL